MQAELTSIWPAMPVRHVSHGLSLTDRIEAQVSLRLPSGVLLATVYIDPTYVRQNGSIFKYLVDACMAFTIDPKAPLQIISHLPPEPCEVKFDFHDGIYMVAQAIPADTQVLLPDGSKGTGVIHFPDAISRWQSPGLWLVDPVQTGPDVFTFPD